MISDYNEEIKRLQEEGLSIKEIAIKLNLYAPSLYSHISKHRDIFPKKRPYRRISEIEYENMYHEYVDQNLSLTEISKKYHVSVETVRRYISKRFKNQ